VVQSSIGAGLVNNGESVSGREGVLFDTVSLQGSISKEDYTDLCSYLINKTAAISFLSCQIDFKKISFQENLDKLRAIQIRGDSEILKIGNLLDKCWALKRFEYIGVSIID